MASRQRANDDIRRSKVKSIRELGSGVKDTSNALQYHQISGETIATLSKYWTGSPKQMIITNTHATLTTGVSLTIFRTVSPTDIILLNKVSIPVGVTLVLDKDFLQIEDTAIYKIQLNVDSGTPTVDVIIKL